MADKATLLALAERVEAARGSDREIDCAIAVALGKAETIELRGRTAWAVRDKDGGLTLPGHAPDMMVKPYTASIDAAMALIPVDQFWRLGNYGEGPDPADFKATVTSGTRLVAFHDAVAATPALALMAAALRARASQEQPA